MLIPRLWRTPAAAILVVSRLTHSLPIATMADGRVRMLDLAAAAVACTVSASKKIRIIAEDKNIRRKDDGSFVTDADFTAQGIIFQSLKAVCPEIRIIGEESPQEMEQHMDPEFVLDEDLLQRTRTALRMRYWNTESETLPLAAVAKDDPLPPVPDVDANADPEETLFDAARVSCIIDPLDGTKSYAHGEYDAVSILICLLVDNQPYFGVIGKPFGYTGLPKILNSQCCTVYGGPLLNHVYMAGAGRVVPTPLVRGGPPSSLPRAVISSSRSKGVVNDFCTVMSEKGLVGPEPLLISGAGEKSLRLILQRHDEAVWFFPKPGTSLWDVAAPDAILRSLGGKLTDKNGHEMDYSKPREEAENMEGVVASIDAALHQDCVTLFKEWSLSPSSTSSSSST